MGLVARIKQGLPRAESFTLTNVPDEALAALGIHRSASGSRASSETAMRLGTFFSCVQVLSQDMGKLPLVLYRRTGNDGRERAKDHRLYRVMHQRPNRFQTSYTFRQTGQVHLALRGNAYAYVNRVRGEVRELLPIHPDSITPHQDRDFNVWYQWGKVKLSQRDVLHVRALSLDGFTGLSVPAYARETIGLALATEAHGARLFSQGALFRGILSHPGRFKSKEVAERVQKSWDSTYSGDNAHGTALLEEGMKYEKVSMTAEDSQFLQTREFQAYDIARWFRMPPHKVGLMKQATFSNIEHQALEYVIDTLLPWLINWEQELNATLLSPAEQEEYFFEHLVDGLLRGDLKTRYEAYKSAVLTGFLNRNEVRQMENRNPAEGLDEFLEPLNMATTRNREADDE